MELFLLVNLDAGVEAPEGFEDGGDSHADVFAESVRVRKEELGASEIDCWDCRVCSDSHCWSSLPEIQERA